MRSLVAVAGLALGLSPPVLAAEPADAAMMEPDDARVVVSTDRPEPRKPSKEERRAQRKIVRDLVHDVTGPLSQSDPIARYHAPLCLGVGGVKQRYVPDFADRILDNAERAGIKLAGDGCKPNAMVIFTGQSRNELREARRLNRLLFEEMGPTAYKRLVRSRDDAFAWRTTRLVDVHGVELGIETLLGPTDQPSSYIGFGMQMQRRIGVAGAVVLIDRDATEGMTALQLADYATLRLLAPTDEIGNEIEGGPPTIMTLFRDGRKAPRQLTEFDLAYLDSVYQLSPGRKAAEVRGDLLVRMKPQ